MTPLEAMKQALEALNISIDAGRIIERYENPAMRPLSEENFMLYETLGRQKEDKVVHAIANLRTAIEQMEKAEPVEKDPTPEEIISNLKRLQGEKE